MLKDYINFLEMCLKMNNDYFDHFNQDNPGLIEKINRYKKIIEEITG